MRWGLRPSIVIDAMLKRIIVSVVTINRPHVIDLIEDAAKKRTGGNNTEAVAQAMRGLLAKTAD